jgi:GntR family transcriptional repressor for pyruvate dehydrogenase complex
MTLFPKIDKPRSVRQAIVHQIQQLLIDGALEEGSRLPPERDLADQLGVGRSSVREAIQVLQIMGLVEVKHGIGTFLTSEPGRWLLEPMKWSTRDSTNLFEELMEARVTVEVELARLGAARGLPPEIDRIRTAVADCAEAEDGVSAGYLVHVAIAATAHNAVLLFMLQATSFLFHEVLEPLRVAVLEHEGGEAELAEFRASQQRGHEAILRAISEHDAQRAAKEMEAHLLETTRFYGPVAQASLSARDDPGGDFGDDPSAPDLGTRT